MTAINDILGQLPLDQLASQLGASPKDTQSAATTAITSLLGGLTLNAQDSQGEASLAGALAQHASSKPVDVAKVDKKDGAKIVNHALGTTPDKAAEAVAGKTGVDPNLLAQLLPLLAPIVMAYLGNQASKSSSGGGSILSGILGGLTGGGESSSSGGLAGLLSGVLGEIGKPAPAAGKSEGQSDGGVLGALLGSLF